MAEAPLRAAPNALVFGGAAFELCGGQDGPISRVIYTLVALAGIWCITLLFRRRDSLPANRE